MRTYTFNFYLFMHYFENFGFTIDQRFWYIFEQECKNCREIFRNVESISIFWNLCFSSSSERNEYLRIGGQILKCGFTLIYDLGFMLIAAGMPCTSSLKGL